MQPIKAAAGDGVGGTMGAPDDPFDLQTPGSSIVRPRSASRLRVATTGTSPGPAISMLEPPPFVPPPSTSATAAAVAREGAKKWEEAEEGERNLFANSHGRMREHPLEVIREFASFASGTSWRAYEWALSSRDRGSSR